MSGPNYIDFLPYELLFVIFTRLSVKSLGNCKCVLKSWNFIISDPDFVNAHLTRTSIDNNFTLISRNPNRGSLYFINFNNNGDGFASRMLYDNGGKEWSRIWGSCNGLILVEDNGKSMFLINATTQEFNHLPALRCRWTHQAHTYNDTFGFGYDSSSDDYIIVAISYQYGSNDGHVYIYTLKTNEWKNVGVWPFDDHLCTRGIFVEGSLNWLAKKLGKSSGIIASFNLANKEFSQILLPQNVYDSRSRFSKLEALAGCLCFTSRVVVNDETEVWVMKEYGVVESWTKLSINLTYMSSFVPLRLRVNSLVLYEGGEFVMLVNDGNGITMEYMEVVGLPSSFIMGMTFVSSLVSPYYRQNMKAKRFKMAQAC